MPRGTIDWKSTESHTRLLAALVASQDLKLNYKKIADYYGQGATYDSIEGRFRIIRKEAEQLKNEVDNGVRPPAPVRGTKTVSPRKPRTPKNESFLDIDPVISGRVTKSVNSTPSKSRGVENKKKLLESGSFQTASSNNTSVEFTDLTSFNTSFANSFVQPMGDFNMDTENFMRPVEDYSAFCTGEDEVEQLV